MNLKLRFYQFYMYIFHPVYNNESWKVDRELKNRITISKFYTFLR